jgi:hypothetical protein
VFCFLNNFYFYLSGLMANKNQTKPNQNKKARAERFPVGLALSEE